MKYFIGRFGGQRWLGLTALALIVALFGLILSPSLVLAQEEAAEAAATPEQQAAYTFNTIVMFVCAVLVLFMQAGFAMLEVGMNAAKNTINILFKNVMDLSVGVLLFFFIGFGLMFDTF